MRLIENAFPLTPTLTRTGPNPEVLNNRELQQKFTGFYIKK